MQPLGTYVAIKPLDGKEKKSQGGIILVSGTEPTSIGQVTAVADAVIEVKAGDKVLYPTGAGTKITGDGEEVLLIDHSKLLAIL